jgi:hypothetical protein
MLEEVVGELPLQEERVLVLVLVMVEQERLLQFQVLQQLMVAVGEELQVPFLKVLVELGAVLMEKFPYLVMTEQ